MPFGLSLSVLLFASFLLPAASAQEFIADSNEVSKAPVCYRVNETGGILHGYYKKGYDLTIYGDSLALGFRADCDMDDDWSGATVAGTTQASNSFESTFRTVFNPHILFGTVLPGNKTGQNHYDGLKKAKVGAGDLTITYKLDSNRVPIDSVVGVVFDRGPQNQPGESSVATCNHFQNGLDDSRFVYIVFPKSARFVKQIIGTKPGNRTLLRNPENADFELAFLLMLHEDSTHQRTTYRNLLKKLAMSAILENFDNPTKEEKQSGLQRPKNEDNNQNE
ncbi:MAG TPA: hypothetical protein PK509_07605 [Catalimonadaceae bacterium]|nr:hypothetical protein [Catalimonadaceae bacterium]HPI10470.1 hypothetical protein [Catalimonadaceae bacterium]